MLKWKSSECSKSFAHLLKIAVWTNFVEKCCVLPKFQCKMTRAGRNADSERMRFFSEEWKRCCLKYLRGHVALPFMKLAKSLCWTQKNKKISDSQIQESSFCRSSPVVGSSECHVKENRSRAGTNYIRATARKPASYCLQPLMVISNDHLRTHH